MDAQIHKGASLLKPMDRTHRFDLENKNSDIKNGGNCISTWREVFFLLITQIYILSKK